MRHNLGVMSNNLRGVVDLLGGLLAVGGDDVLALLNVGGVNNGLAFLARNLARVLLGSLVALPVLLVMALRTSGVALAWFSLTLAISISTITSMSMGNNLRVVSNNMRRVLNLLVCFLAVGGDDVLAFFDVSGVYNNIVLLMAHVMATLLGDLVALPVLLVMALGASGVALAWFSLSLGLTLDRGDSAVHETGGQDENKELHFGI